MPVAAVTFHALGRTIEAGDDLPASDEAVKRYPSLFVSDRTDGPVVEQATAAPGEKRAARARKAAPK